LFLENFREGAAFFEVEPFDGVGLVVEIVDVNLATFEVNRQIVTILRRDSNVTVSESGF
jgi:hypothetical protein